MKTGIPFFLTSKRNGKKNFDTFSNAVKCKQIQITHQSGDFLPGISSVRSCLVVLGALLLELHLAQVHDDGSHLRNVVINTGFENVTKKTNLIHTIILDVFYLFEKKRSQIVTEYFYCFNIDYFIVVSTPNYKNLGFKVENFWLQ